jgi:hypothetical protein
MTLFTVALLSIEWRIKHRPVFNHASDAPTPVACKLRSKTDFVSFDIWIIPCFRMAVGFEAVHIPSFCATEGASLHHKPELGHAGRLLSMVE